MAQQTETMGRDTWEEGPVDEPPDDLPMSAIWRWDTPTLNLVTWVGNHPEAFVDDGTDEGEADDD